MPFPSQRQLNYAESIATALNIEIPDITSMNAVMNFIATNKAAYQAYLSERNQNVRDLITKEIHILDYAQQIGFTPVKVGKYYSLKEHDSIRIDDTRNCFFQNSTGISGSIIDFALTFTNKPLQEILIELEQQLTTNTSLPHKTIHKQTYTYYKQEEKGELILPPKSQNMRNVYAYLIKSRYIDANIVQNFVDRKMLYQDTNQNCVFVSYNSTGKPVFANKRGTNTTQAFKGDCKNCDYSHGFYIPNGSEKLIISEAIIDTMSIMTILKAKNIDYTQFDYLALNGVAKLDCVDYHLKDKNIREVLIATDNDKAGLSSAVKIKEILNQNSIEKVTLHIPQRKDWNDELRANFLHEKDIPFFKNSNLHRTQTTQKIGIQRSIDNNMDRGR